MSSTSASDSAPTDCFQAPGVKDFCGSIISNASGKSTTMKTIMGLVHPFKGEVFFQGHPIHHKTPADIVKAGISPVLEARRIFPEMSVLKIF